MSVLLQLSKFIATFSLFGTLLCTQNQAAESCSTEKLRTAVNQVLASVGCDNYECCKPIIPYSRKLSKEKTFANFEVRELSTKVFSMSKFWGMPHPFRFKAIYESFLCEILTSYGSAEVFSLESLPLYSSKASGVHIIIRLQNLEHNIIL